MANLKTDSPVSRRIVTAFLNFLKSVEPAPGVDLEGLEVVRECLEEVFKVGASSIDDRPHLLVDFFRDLDFSEEPELKSDLGPEISVDAPSTSSAQNSDEFNRPEASQSQCEDWAGDLHALGVSKDELFGQFCGALEKIHFFKTTPAGDDDQVQLDKATHYFEDALKEMEKSGCQTINQNNLAEALKSQGNGAMLSKLYGDAIELYGCAIALCENNAVYYCNRAAAYTQIQRYSDAIKDCNRSIEIDPNYSKAYSRLGLAYYAQGNYSDAISKGFLKALQLDPNSNSIRENIRVAEQKLQEEHQQRSHDQNTGSSHSQDRNNQSTGPRNNSAAPPFTSIPFNASLPPDFASIIMNMAANAYQIQQAHGVPPNSTANGSNEPEIRIGGNINLNFGEEVTEGLTGTLRSVMEMFTSPNEPHEDTHRGSAPN